MTAVAMAGPVDVLAGPLREAAAALGGTRRLLCAQAPADLPDLIDAFAALHGDAFYWEQPAEGRGILALGGVTATHPSGPDRFSSAASWWRDIVAEAESPPGLAAPPIATGGFAFAAEAASPDPIWAGWPRNRWRAPLVVLERRPEGSRLQVQVLAEADPRIALGQALGRVRAALGVRPSAEEQEAVDLDLHDDPSREWWDAGVAAVLAAIEAGTIEKQVLARRARARASRPIAQAAVLRRLRSRFPTATIFAVRRRGRCFLGASPERLVALEGRTVSAVALAGTSHNGDRGAALLRDGKELREHAFVVEALRRRLAPLCSTLDCPQQPQLMVLSNLAHLYTPLRGELAAPTSLLELVRRLHPTPAVGPAPLEPASPPAAEPFDRGWYAGPIGWARGDAEGDMAVALRAALVDGPEATLYAGCGIVRGSEAGREWCEAGLKMEAVRAALRPAG